MTPTKTCERCGNAYPATNDFTFAEVSLAGMLVMNQHCGKRSGAMWKQKIGRDRLAFVASVADQDSAITDFFRDFMRRKWHWGLDDVEA